jgi:hypothetical protein
MKVARFVEDDKFAVNVEDPVNAGVFRNARQGLGDETRLVVRDLMEAEFHGFILAGKPSCREFGQSALAAAGFMPAFKYRQENSCFELALLWPEHVVAGFSPLYKRGCQ